MCEICVTFGKGSEEFSYKLFLVKMRSVGFRQEAPLNTEYGIIEYFASLVYLFFIFPVFYCFHFALK